MAQIATGAFQAQLSKSSERLELMAKVMCEGGIRHLFRKAHELIRSHPSVAELSNLNGKWVRTDPRAWRRRLQVSVTVALAAADRRAVIQWHP